MDTANGKAFPARGEALAGNTDTGLLKLVALASMLIDHMGVVIFPGVTELRVIGRIAMPLYAWCLVVGSVRTRNPLGYGLRLLALALVSQPLYMMALNHSWKDLGILFLLLIALVAIQGIRASRYGSQLWAPALCYLLLGFLKVDYGWRGLTFILTLYLARQSRGGLIAAYLAYAMFWGAASTPVTRLFGYELTFLQWPGLGDLFSAFFRTQSLIWLSLPFLLSNTQSGLRLPKWLGYALYPLHLLLLIALRLLAGATPAALLAGF